LFAIVLLKDMYSAQCALYIRLAKFIPIRDPRNLGLLLQRPRVAIGPARHKNVGLSDTNPWEHQTQALWELPEVTTVANADFRLPEMY
jgi:ribulose bisphosphate carboxylase small subunit